MVLPEQRFRRTEGVEELVVHGKIQEIAEYATSKRGPGWMEGWSCVSQR